MGWRKSDQTELSQMAQLDETQVAFVWAMDWWDGPLNGLAIYQNRFCWFDFHSMDEAGLNYFYVLYWLSEAQVQEAQAWHDAKGWVDFQSGQLVGRDSAKFNPYYEGPQVEATNCQGWFWSGSNPKFYAIEVEPNEMEPLANQSN